MFRYFREGSKIKKIASRLPIDLVELYEEKEFYSRAEVVTVYSDKIGLDDDLQIAIAMFCSPTEFKSFADLQQSVLGYTELRNKVGQHCLNGWPRFNFQTLHDYARGRLFGNGLGGGGDAGGCGGDGGC